MNNLREWRDRFSQIKTEFKIRTTDDRFFPYKVIPDSYPVSLLIGL